jgi:hypothetical protein
VTSWLLSPSRLTLWYGTLPALHNQTGDPLAALAFLCSVTLASFLREGTGSPLSGEVHRRHRVAIHKICGTLQYPKALSDVRILRIVPILHHVTGQPIELDTRSGPKRA